MTHRSAKNRLTPIAGALLALGTVAPAWGQPGAGDPVAAAGAGVATPTAPDPATALLGVQRVEIEGQGGGDFSRRDTSLARLAADLRDVPQSVTVLSKALLQSQGAASLADALRNVPGVTLGGAEGGQIGNNINLNGFTARTDIYLDGLRDRGQYYRDTFALDAVEVLMGPSSMLFGRGSTGGVVNQVSKVAHLKPSTEVDVSATTNGLVRTTVDIDRALDATSAVRVAAMAQSGRPTTRQEMHDTDFGLAPSLRIGIGTSTEITLSALLQRNHDMPDYGVSPWQGRPVDAPRGNFYGDRDDRTNQDVATFSALVSHRFGDDVTLRNGLQSNQVHVDARETASQSLAVPAGTPGTTGCALGLCAAPRGTPLDQLLVKLQSHDRVITDHSVFDQFDLSARLETGTVHHDVIAGAEIGQDTYTNQAASRTGRCNGVAMATGYVGCEPLLAPVTRDSPADVPEVLGNLSTSRATSYGAYLSDTLSFGSRFKLVGGIRRDRFDATIANTITAPRRVAQDVSFTSWRAGGLWQPSPAQSYYVSVSTSFNPSLEQLTNTTGTTAPLPPETNQAWETGAKLDVLAGKLSVDGAVFQVTQDNARAADASGTYTATGAVRVRGARLGGSGLLAPGWKLFAGYARLDATIVDGIGVGTRGMVPANTPRDSATLWTTVELAPHWDIGGGAVHASRRYANNTDTTEVGGYARWDATLDYHQRRFDVRLNLFNLFDRRYFDALIPSDGGRAVPGTGRSAMLTFSYRA